MSLYTSFKTWGEMIEFLKATDDPKCFTVNYVPEKEYYEIWIGNKHHHDYIRLIEFEMHENGKLRQELRKVRSELAAKHCGACQGTGIMYNGMGPNAEPMPCYYCEKGQNAESWEIL